MPNPGVERRTIEVYETGATAWAAERDVQDTEAVRWVDEARAGRPVVDLGTGPGWQLADVAAPAIALDAAAGMLALVPDHAPHALRVRALVEDLPLRPGSLGGAVSNRVHLHLSTAAVPMALADLHRSLGDGARVFLRLLANDRFDEVRQLDGPFAGRLFSGWAPERLHDVCVGAGFEVEALDRETREEHPDGLAVRLTRRATLADTVGRGMRLLICGLNPSPYSVEVGVGFGRPGNRFWPAALTAGVVTTDRNPRLALRRDRIGMTDLAKRPTRTAAELSVDEYREGLARVDRLSAWLRPRAVCAVGLAGWRAAVDRRAVAGVQQTTLGGRPVYLMPSTSGLNAHATPNQLADHLRAAAALADRAAPTG